MIQLWPVLIAGLIVITLLLSRLVGRHRPPVPESPLTFMECNALAGLVRSGTFYTSGVLPEWSRCYDFATKVIAGTMNVPEKPPPGNL